MKIKDILAIVAVALMTGGCSSSDEVQSGEGRVPITLTASVGTEVATRGYQEIALVADEVVYVWGKEGAGDYDYLQAWALTAGTGGTLTGSAKYYPLSGETLTMVALHGNLSYTEGTALPATISHSVEADQSDANAYEKSDLLWATETGSSTNATSKSLVFTHKLSKIEVKLHPGEGYSVSDIASAEVRMRGVLPTITIDPTDGSLGAASGTATLIKARLTEDHLSEATPYALYEAIVPPQVAPTAFLNIKIGEKIATVAADVATFVSNKRYLYGITITESEISVTNTVTGWGDGANNTTATDVRFKLPIEYVAPYNMASTSSDLSSNIYVATTHKMASDNTPQTSAYFRWNSALTFQNHVAVSYSDGSFAGFYHLPTAKEWMTVIAPYFTANPDETDNVADIFPNISGSQGDRIKYNNHSAPKTGLIEEVEWGAHWNGSSYDYEVSGDDGIFYADYYCPSGIGSVGYGLRFKPSASTNGVYTCAYRYEYKTTDVTTGSAPSLTIMVNYVGSNQNININTVSTESYWATSDYTLVLPVCGHKDRSDKDYPSGTYTTSSSVTSATNGHYWSSTQRGEYSFYVSFYNNRIQGNTSWYQDLSSSVRLFKDRVIEGEVGAALSSSAIQPGWVITSDGLAYESKTIAELYGKTPVALVYQMGNTGNATYTHGVAIALADASTGTVWKSANNGTCTEQSSDFNTTKSYMDGVTYTATLVGSSCSGHGHAAATAADSYTPAITGAKWFLPSMGQWCAFFDWCNNGTAVLSSWGWNNNTATRANIRSKLEAAGGSSALFVDTACYWSSTEYATDKVVNVDFHSSNGVGVGYDPKTNTYRVRAFLAF